MAKDMAIIQVCFNLLDPFQRKLYEHSASFPNRSGYVKRLIQWDVDREQGVAVQTPYKAAMAVTEDFNEEEFI